jgi:hypothetical protein
MTFKAKPIKWSSKTTDMWIGIAGPWTFTVTFQGEGEEPYHAHFNGFALGRRRTKQEAMDLCWHYLDEAIRALVEEI